MKKYIAICAALFLLSFSLYARNGGFGWQKAKDSKSSSQASGISQQQKDKLPALLESLRKERKELRQSLREKMKAFHQALQKYNFNKSKLKSLAREIANLRKKLLDLRIEKMDALRKTLDKKQYEKRLRKEAQHRKRHSKSKDSQRGI